MAGGESSDSHIVPARESHVFRFRARLPSPDDHRLLSSSTTVVAGRKCIAHYYTTPRSTHIAFRLAVPDRPVLEAAAKVSPHMVLLDKTGSPAPCIGAGETMDFTIRGLRVRGYRLKAERDDIKSNCVLDNKDSYFDVLCSVAIDWTPPEEELPDLGHDLAVMWDKQQLTDVSFHVDGDSFSAHRLVLATRSPVFRAQLYGSMTESKMTSITIQDMAASTFRSMLYYLYHGSLPDAATGKDVCCSTMAQYQHLLVAADRYGVEDLKKFCEKKLCRSGITIDNVVSMLELAEDHVCLSLKSECFDFLADGEKFQMVATSRDYITLVQSFPSLLVEMQNRFKRTREESTTVNNGAHKKSRVC